jgi:hypothetical protein
MHLTATGTEIRRAIVLILHESSKPATTLVHHWTPKGLCKKLSPQIAECLAMLIGDAPGVVAAEQSRDQTAKIVHVGPAGPASHRFASDLFVANAAAQIAYLGDEPHLPTRRFVGARPWHIVVNDARCRLSSHFRPYIGIESLRGRAGCRYGQHVERPPCRQSLSLTMTAIS